MKTLNEIPRENPFKVPENYFEEANSRIIASGAGTQPGVDRKGTLRRLKPILLVAASVAGFILLSYSAMKIFLPERGSNMPDIVTQELTESSFTDIDIQTLEQYTDPAFLNMSVSDLTTTEIIDYLVVGNIDINDIYERL
jgi:hypothetical protein